MRLFQEDMNIVYTDRVSDAEYERKIMYGQPIEYIVKYYDDIAEKVLTEDFTLKKCPGKHIWYGEWENHRRIVIKLYKFYSYEVRFGYNYDFIPRLNGRDKFVYYRTDKSVDLDVMDYYFNHITYEPEHLTHMESFHIRRKYELPDSASGLDLDFAKKYIEDIIRTNISFMKEFFKRYESDLDILGFLDYTIKYGNHFERYWYIWTKSFLYAKLHRMDEAIETMRCYYDRTEIPEKVIERLERVNAM